MFKTNQPKETMFTRNAMIKGISKATDKDKLKKEKRTVETVKQELSKIEDKIENMLEKNVSETDPKFDKLNTKQNDLDHELDFLINVMGEK